MFESRRRTFGFHLIISLAHDAKSLVALKLGRPIANKAGNALLYRLVGCLRGTFNKSANRTTYNCGSLTRSVTMRLSVSVNALLETSRCRGRPQFLTSASASLKYPSRQSGIRVLKTRHDAHGQRVELDVCAPVLKPFLQRSDNLSSTRDPTNSAISTG
jgi:hypothetical protein